MWHKCETISVVFWHWDAVKCKIAQICRKQDTFFFTFNLICNPKLTKRAFWGRFCEKGHIQQRKTRGDILHSASRTTATAEVQYPGGTLTWTLSSLLAGRCVNCGALSLRSVTRMWTAAVALRRGRPLSVTITFRLCWLCCSRSKATQLIISPGTGTERRRKKAEPAGGA